MHLPPGRSIFYLPLLFSAEKSKMTTTNNNTTTTRLTTRGANRKFEGHSSPTMNTWSSGRGRDIGLAQVPDQRCFQCVLLSFLLAITAASHALSVLLPRHSNLGIAAPLTRMGWGKESGSCTKNVNYVSRRYCTRGTGNQVLEPESTGTPPLAQHAEHHDSTTVARQQWLL